MSEKKIIQFDSASEVTSDAYVPITQPVNGNQKTLKALIDQLGAYISRVQQYNDLDTTAKDLIGAINEAAESGSVEMETSVTTPVSIASINDGGDNIPVKSLKVLVSAVQSGSGTPSPSNIRSISGWSGCNLSGVAENLWDEEWVIGGISPTTGEDTPSSTSIRTKNYIPCRPNTTYYKKIGGGYSNCVYYYDKNKTFLSRDTNGNSQSLPITTPDDCYFMRFDTYSTYGTTYRNDISINYPSTDTTYHAYKGTTHTIPFGQTVYGGLLDVTNGVLTITHGIVDLGSLSWLYTGGTDSRMYCDFTMLGSGSPTVKSDIVSEMFDTATSNEVYSHVYDNIIAYDNNGHLWCYSSDYTDPSIFTTAVTGKYLVYKLATPTTIYLTPTQVKTLLTCNIFADTGDIDTLIYFNSNADEVADVVEAYVGDVVNLYATLATGNTSVTISSSAIHTNSTIDIYTDNDVDYISAVVTEGQIVVTFDAQASDLGVKVRVS